jgi:hypothetical protein
MCPHDPSGAATVARPAETLTPTASWGYPRQCPWLTPGLELVCQKTPSHGSNAYRQRHVMCSFERCEGAHDTSVRGRDRRRVFEPVRG